MGRSNTVLTAASPDQIAAFAGHEPSTANPGQVNKKLHKSSNKETVPLKVVHKPNERKFELKIGEEIAYLQYKEASNGALDLFKTYTPDAIKGKGAAALLATEAFNFATKNNKKIIPSCSYIRDNFLGTNQQYKKMVVTSSAKL